MFSAQGLTRQKSKQGSASVLGWLQGLLPSSCGCWQNSVPWGSRLRFPFPWWLSPGGCSWVPEAAHSPLPHGPHCDRLIQSHQENLSFPWAKTESYMDNGSGYPITLVIQGNLIMGVTIPSYSQVLPTLKGSHRVCTTEGENLLRSLPTTMENPREFFNLSKQIWQFNRLLNTRWTDKKQNI